MQFTKNTSYRKNTFSIFIKLSFVILIIIGAIFLLNKIDFPAQKRNRKIISNENFKIVK